MNELRMAETELAADVAALKRENEATIAPQLSSMVAEIADCRAEYARAVSHAEGTLSSKSELITRIGELEAQVIAASLWLCHYAAPQHTARSPLAPTA